MATGKYAKFISDRSGMEFPYKEMRVEWNGARVHMSEYEKKHPQLEPKRFTAEPQGLRNARPARVEPAVARLLGANPFRMNQGSATVFVSEPKHGRSANDVVRFRNGEGNFGITTADINKSAGFTITKVDANNYTFVAAGTATANTNIGGGEISAGPVTLSP